jgi:adenosylcobinamide kinase / adenosylcobinamide-phosphate guanylyltransferase
MFTFVSGGLRSGKSDYALRRASELGPPPWLYVAPEVEGDDDVTNRLAQHRRDQEAIWRVKDAPVHLQDALTVDLLEGAGAMVLDRFAAWVAGRMPVVQDRELLAEVEELADRLYRSPVPVVVVTTEVGLGFVSTTDANRRLIDLVGSANRVLAERAQSVVFLVSGVAQRLR